MIPAQLLAAFGAQAAANDPRTQMMNTGSRRLVSPPANPLDFFQQAQNLPDAAQRKPAFRTADLIAPLLAALAGPQGGDVLAGYAQGKAQKAQQDTQRDQNAVDRQRQALIFQGQQAQARAAAEAAAAEKEANRASRERIAGVNADTRLQVAQTGADTQLKKAQYQFDGKRLDNETKRYGLDLVSKDGQAKAALGQLMKLPEKARPGFAQALADNLPSLQGWSPDAIMALGQSTAAEESKRAQAQEFKARTGYYGARAKNLEALTDPQKQALLARANKANADARTQVERAGLIEAQTGLIEKKVANYEPEMRARMARHLSNVAKTQGQTDAKAIATQKQAYGGLLRLANDQIKRIKATHDGSMGIAMDPDALAAYTQAVQDQQEASEALKRLNRAQLSPVTQGRPQPAPNPAATGQGAPAQFAPMPPPAMPPVLGGNPGGMIQGSPMQIRPMAPSAPAPTTKSRSYGPPNPNKQYVTVGGRKLKVQDVMLDAQDAIRKDPKRAAEINARLKALGLRK